MMVESKTRATAASTIREILDIWDRYQRLAGGRPTDEEQRSRLVEIETALVSAAQRDRGALGALVRGGELGADELRVVLLLLRRLLSENGPALKGKKILNTLFSGTFEILRGTRLLAPDGSLRANGIIESTGASQEGPAILESEYRLGNEFFERLRAEFGETPPETEPKRYADNLEYLLDLKSLAIGYRRRSEILMRAEESDDDGASTPGVAATRRIRRRAAAIRARLERTPDSERFAAVRFQRRYRLSEEEMVLAVTLFFQEIHNGNSFAEMVELVRLVSDSERDLFRNRRLLAERSALVREGILVLEEDTGEQELGREVCLSPWAFEAILGAMDETDTIDSDARIAFHEFLERMNDSGDFFSKIQLPPDADD